MLSPKSVCLYTILVLSICMPSSKYSQTVALIDDVVEVLKLGKDIASTLLETWNLVEQTNLGGGVELPFRKEKQKKILNKMNEVSRKINSFEDDVSRWMAILRFSYPVFLCTIKFPHTFFFHRL